MLLIPVHVPAGNGGTVEEVASWQPASNGESPRHWHHGFPTGAEAIVEGHTFLFFLMVQYLLALTFRTHAGAFHWPNPTRS